MRVQCSFLFLIVSTISIHAQDSTLTVLEHSSILPVKQFHDPRVNFDHATDRIHAGDINGDSISDFYSIDFALNELTTDPSDYVYKTSYWFGADTLTLYPDIVVYRAEDPVGDLNGDGIYESISVPEIYNGNGSTTGLLHISTGDSLIINVHNSMPKETRDYAKFIDLDNDGFNDLISFNHDKRSNQPKEALIHVIWGGAVIDESSIHTYRIPKADSLHRNNDITLRAVDLYEDESVELVIHGYAGNSRYLDIYTFNSNRELAPLQETNISLPISNKNNTVTFNYISKDSLFLFSSNGILASLKLSPIKTTPILEESLVITNHNTTLIPIGDFDGNGIEDYLTSSSNQIYSLVEIDLAGNLTNNLQIEGFWAPSINASFNHLQQPIDLNQDGFNDFTFSVNDFTDKFIYLAYGNTNRTLENIQEIDASFIQNDRYTIPSAFNIGDLNKDGFDDLVALETNFYASTRLTIYNGGSDFNSQPDQIVFIDDTVNTIGEPVLGDIDGDNNDELLFTYATSTNLNQVLIDKAVLAVVDFDATESPTINRIHTYDLISEIDQELVSPRRYQIGILGDINEDGAEDFAISADFSKNYDSTYIYLGGNNMFSNQPFVIPMQSNDIIGLGDINSNGSANFALANPKVEDQTISRNANGQVHIFEYNTSINQLSDTVLVLGNITYNEDNTDYKITDRFGHSISSGDFNGDGITDLAVLPEIHYDFTFRDPQNAIYIYYGGENFDATFDYSFPIFRTFSFLIDEDLGITEYSGDRYISTLPDVNNDGASEIIYLSESIADRTHPLLFKGDLNGTIDASSPIIFKSPHPDLALGSKLPSVGRFTNSENQFLVLNQYNDLNNLSDPLYLFELPPEIVSSSGDYINDKLRSFKLSQNYPNPFNPSTNIQFTIPSSSTVSLVVYDILGREVAELLNQPMESGYHTKRFDGSALASGIYLYKLTVNGTSVTKKMLLVK